MNVAVYALRFGMASMNIMDRNKTMEFLSIHVKTEMLIKHLLSVETV
jgi:predicted hydrolase (HD superfamily)